MDPNLDFASQIASGRWEPAQPKPDALSVPVQNSALLRGAWQGVYLFEHRRAPHTREVALHFIGE